MDDAGEATSMEGAVSADVEPIGWMVEEVQVLVEMLARSTSAQAPSHLDRFALKERDEHAKPPEGWRTEGVAALFGLGYGGPVANGLFGLSSDFPVRYGVNVDLVSAKWNSMTDEEQQTLFTQIMTVANAGIPPTREAFEQVGILITDGFE